MPETNVTKEELKIRALEEAERRLKHYPPGPQAVTAHEAVRASFNILAKDIVKAVPTDTREYSLYLTHLEEAMFWANAAIARNHNKL